MKPKTLSRKEIEKLLDELYGSAASKLEVIATESEIIIRKPHKIRKLSELKGLGKDLWQGIDSRAYLETERRSWHKST